MAAVAVPGALWATSCLFLVFIGQKKKDHEDDDDYEDGWSDKGRLSPKNWKNFRKTLCDKFVFYQGKGKEQI